MVALGIGIDDTKHPLALVEGSTENATPARELLVDLRERGLNVTTPILLHAPQEATHLARTARRRPEHGLDLYTKTIA